MIGGSLALALQKRRPDWKLKLWARSEASAQRARQFFPEATTDAAAAAQDANVAVLCTPIGAMPSLGRAIAPHLPGDAVVTDAGSVKGAVVGQLESIFGERFVGAHPMAGSEKNGLVAARADLFERAACILTPTEKTSAAALSVIHDFWKTAGCRIMEMTPRAHDEAVGRVSHLPHAVAATLVNTVSLRLTDAASLAGGGYRDSTRIAAGPPSMWAEIFLENRDELVAGLEDFSTTIDDLKRMILAGDTAAMEGFLSRAKSTRDSVP